MAGRTLPRNIKIAPMTIIMIIVIGWLAFSLWKISDVILIVLTAVVRASFVEGLARGLMRYRVPRVLAAMIVYVIIIGAFAGVLYAFIPTFLGELARLAEFLPADSGITQFLSFFQGDGLESNLSEGETALTEFTRNDFNKYLPALYSAFGGFVNLILVLVISFYLSIEDRGVEKFFRAVTPLQYEDYVVSLWQRTEYKIGQWFKGQLLSAVILGVLTYLGLTLMGVDYALMLSLLAALLGLVPFGIILATVPAVIVAFLSGGPYLALMVLGWYFILQQFENNLLQPVIINRVT